MHHVGAYMLSQHASKSGPYVTMLDAPYDVWKTHGCLMVTNMYMHDCEAWRWPKQI